MVFYICVCALSLLAYYVYRIVSWYRRIILIGARVDKLPGDDRHWLYGNLKNVSRLLHGELVQLHNPRITTKIKSSVAVVAHTTPPKF